MTSMTKVLIDMAAMKRVGMMTLVSNVWSTTRVQILVLLMTLFVLPVFVSAAPLDEQEYFDANENKCDYAFWTPSTTPDCTTTTAAFANGSLGTHIAAQAHGTTNTHTPSNTTGPLGLHSGTEGSGGGFLYIEASGTGPYTAYFTRDTSFDADANFPNISFAFDGYGANLISLSLQVNQDGGGWQDVWVLSGADANGSGWQTADINLNDGTVSIDGGAYASTTTVGGNGTAYTSGLLDMRFVFNSNSYAGDYAIDTVRVYGADRCVPSTGPVTLNAGGSKNGDNISVCDLINLTGTTLTNVTIMNGATEYYNGASCSNIPTTSGSGAPVDWSDATLDISVTADNDCSTPTNDAGTFDFTTCIASAGPLEVASDFIFSGTTVDVTSVVTKNGANLADLQVWEIGGVGADIDDFESFENGGGVGWDPLNWVATIEDGVTLQNDPPQNGDLMTDIGTRTATTGPGASLNGNYLFYESSQATAHTDRYLVNQNLYDAGNHDLHVEFMYNMNGADIGTLELQAKNPNYNSGAWTTEWTLSGHQGDVWTKAIVDLHSGTGASSTAYVNGNTELRFRFTYGGGPYGDIAVDKVRILGPRQATTQLFDGTELQAQTAKSDGSGGFPVWPEATIRVDVSGTDNCGGPLSAYGFGSFQVDLVAPTVSSFNLPLTSLSPISVFSFAANDNIAVTGYMITETATQPGSGDAGWSVSPPLKLVPSGTGDITFYAWAKDAAGNVSSLVPGVSDATVTVNPDVTAPTITQFTLPSASFPPVSVSAFTATDDSGAVTGYMVTEVGVDADPSGPSDPRWLAMPPSKLYPSATGSTDFKAWVKDASGNLSAFVLQNVDVLEDTNLPTVSFILPSGHDALEVPITTFSASDLTGGAEVNTGVAAYMTTTSATAPAVDDPNWHGTPPSSVHVPAADTPTTFWAWAKDNSDNISVGISQTVTVTLPQSCVFEMDPNGTLIQTENWTSMAAPNPWAWDTVFTPLPDASVNTTLNDGNGDLSVDGYIITAAGGTGSTPNGSRADYPVFFPSGSEGNWCIWIRAMDQSGNGGGDSNFWGVDGSYVGAMTQYHDNQWSWANGTQNGAKCTNISVNGQDGRDPDGAGPLPEQTGQWHTINLWPREQGQKNDMFYLVRSTSTTANGAFPNAVQQNGRYDDIVTVLPQTAYTEIDPTCVDTTGGGAPGGGGGSGYINIPDGQAFTGSPLDVTQMYDTDLGGTFEYRALGEPSDGFEHQTVDAKWFHSNIGNEPLLIDTVPMVEGQGIFKLAGSGSDIYNTNDFFAYHYQPNILGDFTIDVNMKNLVDKQSNTTANQNAWAKAGIMVRQSLSTNSRNVMMLVSSTNGSRLQYRPTDGAQTTMVNGTDNGVAAGDNTWLRLKRTGNQFEGFHSTDNGQSWVSVGTAQVSMSGAVNIGLGVTSHNTARDSIGYFDNFLFMPAGLSGMSESWSDTASGLDTTQPLPWTEGLYGVAVRNMASGVYAANTFDYNPCVDTTPSSITVHSGATVSGSAVSLPGLFDHSGNVGGFTYEIDGNAVNNPWNSFSVVPPGTSGSVNLHVAGTDPDCGGTFYTDSAFINIDNTCNDPDPSTITILTGQVAGGPNVDLTRLYTSTGDVGSVSGFTFRINGATIGDPGNWDSRVYGSVAAETVTLEISGIDPDCGNSIVAVNEVIIDNTCVRNPPSISFDRDINHVGPGRAVPYKVTIRNEDSFNCGPSTFDVTVASDSNSSDFVASYFNPVGSNLNITLQGRETRIIELAVEATAGATEWNTNTTTLDVDCLSAMPEHPTQSKAVTTKVFLVSPITHNSVTTGSGKWSGSWGTSEPGSKYGNFDCMTCHQKDGANIKWMRSDIATPDGSVWGVSGANTLPIQFRDARSGDEITSDADPDDTVYWGHDDFDGSVDADASNVDTLPGAGRNASNRVCEVCHSATMYHRYDTQTDPDAGGPLTAQAALNHFPDRDCTDCHRHSLGFTASCVGCHGDPPLEATLGGPNGLADIPAATGSVTPGTHYKHTVVLEFPCEYCHAGWRNDGEMPKEVNGKQQINHTFNVFYDLGMTDPTKDNGHYTGQDGVNYQPYQPAIDAGNQLADGTIPPGKGTMTCENIYCHGGTETMGGVNPQWNGNIACNSCHGTSAENTPPGYSHTTHVKKMGLECTTCHFTGGKDAGYNGHVNGRVNLEMNTPSWKGLTPMYDPDGTANLDGGTDLAATTTWNSNPDGSDMPPSSQYGTCLNVACHYGTETPPWNNNNQPATCTTCHNDNLVSGDGVTDGNTGLLVNASPDTGYHEEHVHPSMAHAGDPASKIAVSEKMIGTYVNACESCHGGGSNTGEHLGHVNFQVDLGGGMTFNHTAHTCTSQCHSLEDDAGGHITWPADVPGPESQLGCQACHKAPYLGPTVVDPDGENTGMPAGVFSPFGSHLQADSTDSFGFATDWSTQCRKCHPYHEDTTGVVKLTNPPSSWINPATGADIDLAQSLGFNYTVTGGVHLGGTVASGASEAQICWNCHGSNTSPKVSEWATPSLNGYTVIAAGDAWNVATFNAPGTQIPDRPVVSMHSANPLSGISSVGNNIDGTGVLAQNSLEAVNTIRCSYCHDVHDLNRAPKQLGSLENETEVGQPYLRASWFANPYPLERPPQNGDSYDNDNDWANYNEPARPRLYSNSVGSTRAGGYFIDQNSGWPTHTDGTPGGPLMSVAETAGLCTLCHGNDVDNMDYYTASSMWTSKQANGHSNSTLGGSGSNKRNIFDGQRGKSGAVGTFNMAVQSSIGNNNQMGDTGDRAKNSGPLRNSFGAEPANGSQAPPRNTGWYGGTPGATSQGTEYSAWYSGNTTPTDTASIGTAGSNSGRAHDFPCSKCHAPHASGLPALLVTNCLDNTVGTSGNAWTASGGATIGPRVTTGLASTAQNNCHRKGNNRDDGWHNLAPGQ